MKKIIYLVFLFISSNMMAQNSKVVSAYNANEDGEYVKALEYINAAIKHEKTKDEAKTWLYRGQIYQNIAASDEDFGVSKISAIDKSLQSYEKALALDTKERWTEKTKLGLIQMRRVAMQGGVSAYNEKNYEDAMALFAISEKAAEARGEFDTLSVYNGGLAAEQAGDYAVAITQYQKVADVGYLGPKMFLYMANLYNKQEMPDKFIAVVQEGRAKYPEDADLIVYELNYYLRNNKFEEAKENLKLAIEKEPQNKQLYFSLGVVYDNLKEYDKAIVEYKNAIELDSLYFDAIFNLGALYFNKGVEMTNSANDIIDNTEYEAAKAEAEEVFRIGLPYLEKAYELNPEDQGAVASLTQLYALLGMDDKYDAMKALQETQTPQE